jgi:DNA-binding NarL/FixJ family response regulator
MPTVLIVDDHAIVRQGLERMLSHCANMQIVGEACDGREALDMVRKLCPDLVILDISMPRLNGLLATRQIVKECPSTRVLIFSMHADEAIVAQALRAGAAGYVEKGASVAEMRNAIEAICAGGHYLSPRVTGLVLSSFTQPNQTAADTGLKQLTPREQEVLQLVAEGLSSKEIAAELHISVRTVDTHRENIMSKLDIRSVAGLVKWAIRHGLSTLDG